MRLLIMGAPGSGKGTQSHALAERYQIPAISTGNIFRTSVARGTALGRKIDKLLQTGNFVPDLLTEEVVAERLGESDAANGWLLDGYPRTLHQVEALDEFLDGEEDTLDGVIFLEVAEEKLIQRLLLRRTLEGREDDTADAIKRRMEIFEKETQPILQVYKDRGLLIQVDGDGRIEDVSERIAIAVKGKLGS